MKIYQNFIWLFLKLTYGLFSKFFYNIKYIKDQKDPRPPYLLLANHAYHVEAFFIANFLEKPAHYLSSDEIAGFSQQLLGELTGIIYTEKGNIDSSSIREVVKAVKKKESIAIFPEGDGCWDGETVKISNKIIKLVRMLNIPLMTVNLAGSYLTKSRWSSNYRKGRVFITFKIITADRIRNMTDDELYFRITSDLYNNELKNPVLDKVVFKGKNIAEGIQYLLWLCPCCNSHDTIKGEGNNIICSKCGKSAEINANLKLLQPINDIHDIKDWNEMQKKYIKEMIGCNEGILTSTSDVRLNVFDSFKKGLIRNERIYKTIADGELALTNDKLIFKPFDNSGNIEFSVSEIKNHVDCVNKFFRFNCAQNKYEIIFKGKNSSKYIYFLNNLLNIEK